MNFGELCVLKEAIRWVCDHYWSISVTFQRIVETDCVMLTSRGHQGTYRTSFPRTLIKNRSRDLKMHINILVSTFLTIASPVFGLAFAFEQQGKSEKCLNFGCFLLINLETNRVIHIFKIRKIFFRNVWWEWVLYTPWWPLEVSISLLVSTIHWNVRVTNQ